jgi:hypothetical protein
MSLPDTAEYWWDVKSPSKKRVFVHKKGLDCGHFHVHETQKMRGVDCYACIKILKETVPNYEQIMNTEPEPTYGRCSCGHARVKRINTKTKEEFLGCSHWPKCKITSPYKK